MPHSVSDYRDALLALLPRGDAWPTDPESELGKLMHGIAEEFARLDQRAQDLLTESHPSQTFELFSEWENEYGLPDSCTVDPSFQQRLAALIQKYQMQGGQSREFFLSVAEALGYDISITEQSERVFGADFGTDYASSDLNWVLQINALLINYQERSFGAPFGDTYRAWGNSGLECAFNRLVHAHRYVVYSYLPFTPEEAAALQLTADKFHDYIHGA